MNQRWTSRSAAAILLLGSLAGAHGQDNRPAPAAAADTRQTAGQDEFLTPKTANTQNLAKAEQEDEEYVFRHSSSVRAFGRLFHLSPDAASLSFWALNFIILAGFVGFAFYKGLPKAFRARRERIAKQLLEARTATEEANTRLRSVEERLSRLDADIASFRATAERDSIEDEQRIKASMEEERRKILASAEGEIASASAWAERRLRNFAAELAVERATSRIHLTEDDDQRLIREFASSLPSGGRNGGRG